MSSTDSRSTSPFSLAPGTKGKGWLPVSRRPGGGELAIPWMAVRGAAAGPVLAVNGSVHGDEYEGGEAIRQLWAELDPAHLRGTWIGVPAVNVAAYEMASRVSPLDGLNLNRVFPGDATPTASGMVARRYFHEIVTRSEAVLDLHSGGNPLSMLPLVAYAEASPASLALAEHTGLDVLWRMPPAWSGSLCVAASAAGVPTVTPEIGNDGRLDPGATALMREVVVNVMRALGLVEAPALPEAPPRRRRVVRGSYIPAAVGGLFQPAVRLGDVVKRGQRLATIRDVFGDVVEEIAAPVDGLVCSYRTIPPVMPGDQTVLVGEVVEER
jgi:predicted deacylase